jgi:hypothetical protein
MRPLNSQPARRVPSRNNSWVGGLSCRVATPHFDTPIIRPQPLPALGPFLLGGVVGRWRLKGAANLRRPYGQSNIRRPLSRRLEAGIQPLIYMRGSVDLPDLLEKFIPLCPWL